MKKRLVQLEKMQIVPTLLLHIAKVFSLKASFTKQQWEVILYRVSLLLL